MDVVGFVVEGLGDLFLDIIGDNGVETGFCLRETGVFEAIEVLLVDRDAIEWKESNMGKAEGGERTKNFLDSSEP